MKIYNNRLVGVLGLEQGVSFTGVTGTTGSGLRDGRVFGPLQLDGGMYA